MREALRIQVKGIVQGVGFRPFVYKEAKRHLVTGWVLNAVDGVTIHAEGEQKLLDEFVIALSENYPAVAQVDEIELREVPLEDYESFEITFSDESPAASTTLISPDLATCEDCTRELFNSKDRRYRYPFINCTNCGPRFTIIEKLPYDRPSTSMRSFALCPECQSEYDDPTDRRFHAQPNACFTCGPVLSWRLSGAGEQVTYGATREESDALITQAVEFLREGKIVALKGLGGFHLACDGGNEQAVARLRERKKREGKPFAVMMKDVETAARFCHINTEEEALLTGAQRPIVLLKKRSEAPFVLGLADHLAELGVMLPYTPLQHLILDEFAGILVMTSGNVHDEPIVIDDEEAYTVLADIADAFLGNNREIRARYDDSVVRVIAIGEGAFTRQFVRRARGYAPAPLVLPVLESGEETSGRTFQPSIFAAGPEQKNTFCLTRGADAFVSQHIGDMENVETYDAWLETKTHYERLFEITPDRLACDMHPEYLTTKWAREHTELPRTEVQHHHAHTVSVMAENKLQPPICGIAFDGTGYGVDGAIWGGEVLLANYETFERFANFSYIPLPGGVAAIKSPLRIAYGALWAFDLLEHPAAVKALDVLGAEAGLCEQMIEKGINTPYTSSVGRLFDAASALLGICTQPKYEGEAAVLLEAAIHPAHSTPHTPRLTRGLAETSQKHLPHISRTPHTAHPPHSPRLTRGLAEDSQDPQQNPYPISIIKNTATAESTAQDTSVLLIDAAPTFEALLNDVQSGVSTSEIAHRFHHAIVDAIVQIAQLVYATYEIDTFALSGGVFLNRFVIEHAVESLTARGYTVALNQELPPSDGCISYGQAVVALHS